MTAPIAIIGAGHVGQALAGALARTGRPVLLGVKEAAQHQDTAAALGSSVRAVPVADAIHAAAVVILAVPYTAAASVAASVPDWQGRVLVDATNPIAPGLAGLSLGTSTSGAEQVAVAANGARVVKAFNTTGAENMAQAHYAGGRPWMPVCGDDAEARQTVLELAEAIGFEAVDCGALNAARYLEPFAMTWIHLAFKAGLGRRFAFALLRR